jgi:5-methylcytosine-specific restriction protein B
MQGIRPQNNDAGVLRYEMVTGRFIDFCRRAEGRRGASVLIIDEINRANLSSVFGELMYLLEYRNREVPLAGGGMFRIPANVRIIGTMNTADRSVALVDHALRRRFGFIRLDPDYDVLSRFHQRFSREVGGLIGVLTELNAAIRDVNYSVGISYFMREALADHLEAIWTEEIEPYIEELFFDNRSQFERFRWPAIAQKVAM